MTKEDIARLASAKTGVTIAVSEKITQEVLNAIIEAVIRGESVQIRGFGTFAATTRARRVGRDINTNEAKIIPKRVVPVFYPSAAFKDKVSSSSNLRESLIKEVLE